MTKHSFYVIIQLLINIDIFLNIQISKLYANNLNIPMINVINNIIIINTMTNVQSRVGIKVLIYIQGNNNKMYIILCREILEENSLNNAQSKF